MVTRPRAQAGALADRLRARGARVIVAPAIRLVPAPAKAIDHALDRAVAGEFAWVVVTSRTGAEILLAPGGAGPRPPGPPREGCGRGRRDGERPAAGRAPPRAGAALVHDRVPRPGHAEGSRRGPARAGGHRPGGFGAGPANGRVDRRADRRVPDAISRDASGGRPPRTGRGSGRRGRVQQRIHGPGIPEGGRRHPAPPGHGGGRARAEDRLHRSRHRARRRAPPASGSTPPPTRIQSRGSWRPWSMRFADGRWRPEAVGPEGVRPGAGRREGSPVGRELSTASPAPHAANGGAPFARARDRPAAAPPGGAAVRQGGDRRAGAHPVDAGPAPAHARIAAEGGPVDRLARASSPSRCSASRRERTRRARRRGIPTASRSAACARSATSWARTTC